MNKGIREALWLFAIPVLIILPAIGLRGAMQPYPFFDTNVGTFTSYQAGEKVALSRLSQELKAHPEAVNFMIHWAVGKKVGDPGNSFVGIGYSRREGKVSSFDLKSSAEPTVFKNIKDDTIHELANAGGSITNLAH